LVAENSKSLESDKLKGSGSDKTRITETKVPNKTPKKERKPLLEI
jgi:hypothetical protein